MRLKEAEDKTVPARGVNEGGQPFQVNCTPYAVQ